MALKIRRVLSKIFIILAFIIVAILVVRAVFNYTTGKKLKSYLETAKAQGIPLTVRSMVPNCPDSANAARLWKAAEILLLIDGDAKSLLVKANEDFFHGRPIDETSRNTLSRSIEKNRRALDLMIEAAERPCFRYKDWSTPAYDFQVVSTVNLIPATRLMAVDVVLRAERGEIREALDECLAGMRLIRKSMDEPLLINTLIATALMKTMLISFERIAAGSDLDPETLTFWMNEMDPQPWRQRFARSIPAERALNLEVGLDLIWGSGESMAEPKGPSVLERMNYWLFRPMLKSQLLRIQKPYSDLEKIALWPYNRQKEFLSAQRQRRSRISALFGIFGDLPFEFKTVFMKQATLEAMMLTARAGLACKIFKTKTGRYPEKLEALVPDILKEIPLDPFTGKPLVYKVQDGEVLIYSLGSNEKDDGGRGTYMIAQLVTEKDDDWAWREAVK